MDRETGPGKEGAPRRRFERRDKPEPRFGTLVDLAGTALLVAFENSTEKIFLASVGPAREFKPNQTKEERAAERKEQREMSALDRFFLDEYQQLLRKLCIDKKLECYFVYDGVPNAQNISPEKKYYDVLVDGQNIAIELTKRGLATFMFTSNQKQQSFNYIEIEKTDSQAQASHVGRYNTKLVPRSFFDLSRERTTKNSERYLYDLKQSAAEGYIEYCFSLTKYKVVLPSLGLKIVVSLSGVKQDKSEDAKTRQLLQQGLDDVRLMAHLRDVKVNVFAMDKMGSFIGEIALVKKNIVLNEYLVRNGLCDVFDRTGGAYQNAKNEAVTNKAGIWKFHEEKVQIEETRRKVQEKPTVKSFEVGQLHTAVVVGFNASDVFYYNSVDEAAVLDTISGKLNGIPRGKIVQADKTKVAVALRERNYRGVIEKWVPSASRVLLIDNGIVVTIGKTRMKEMPEGINDPVTVNKCQLFGVKFPDDLEEGTVDLFKKLETESASIGFIGSNEDKQAVLMVNETNFALELLKKGLCFVPENLMKVKSDLLDSMREAELEGKKAKLGVWKFGDFDKEVVPTD